MRRKDALRLRRGIVRGSASLPDAAADTVPELFEPWRSGEDYAVGDRRRYGALLYKCIQAHTSQEDWTPDAAVSLWTRTSADEWPEWVQPTGATDAYMTGDKVTYKGTHYISIVDHNTWPPDVYGWEAADDEE